MARDAGLVVDSIGDELLVYDTECGRAHSLNAVAAAVWRACDGQRDVDQLAGFTGFDRGAVELALNNLLDVELITGYAASGVSRRAVLRRLSLTAAGLAVALPVIRSITAPTAAMALSNAGDPCSGQTCGAGSYCGSTSSCQTGTLPAKGAKCTFGNVSCAYGSHCMISGKCA
jgi:coenzyme PQQ synthesis protein D (PqqD)